MRTKRVRSVAFAAVVAAGLALVASACGGGGGGGTTTTPPSPGQDLRRLQDRLRPGHRLPRSRASRTPCRAGRSCGTSTCRCSATSTSTARPARHSCRISPRRMPTVTNGGQDVQVHAAQGSEVLRRDADQGERLQGDDHPRLQGRLAGCRLLRQHRRRRRVRLEPEDAATSGHHGRRRRRQDHDQPDGAAGRLRVHHGDDVCGARACRVAGQGHVDDSACPASGPY